MKRFISVLAATLISSSAFAAVNNGALDCGTTDTYYPQSWWAPTRSGSTDAPIKYALQRDGLPSIGGGADFYALQQAFSAWSGITCGAGVSKLTLARDADWPTKDSGDTAAPGGGLVLSALNNVVFFQTENWTEDESILALTNNLSASNGRTGTADIIFNAVSWTWRATGSDGVSRGCAKPAVGTASTCYDVRSTATHEVGHFLGLYHVSCQGAVMYPTSSPVSENYTLSSHERAGMCALYAPLTTPLAATLQRGEACDFQGGAACGTGLTCFRDPTFPANIGWGVCTSTCTAEADCPTAFSCDTAAGYCVPGPHNTGSSATPPTDDGSCVSCLSQADCDSGICVRESATSTSGFCSQACSTTFPCATGFTCEGTTDPTQNYCFPNDPTSCAAAGDGDTLNLNDECYNEDPNGDGNTSDKVRRDCSAGLICIGFKPNECATQIGGCVNYCNAFSQPYNGQRCPDPNEQCCYGVNDDGTSCRKVAVAGRDEGGCFTERKIGESCVLPEHAFCEAGSRCLYADTNSGSAMCYRLCDSSSCNSDEVCLTGADNCGDALSFCCDVTEYRRSGACIPHGVNFKRQVGVECSDDTECASGVCYHLNGQSACSRRCNNITGGGCPGNIDVNGDAKVDGGFTCRLEANGDGWCWLRSDKPAPYLSGDQPSEDDGGCAAAGADMFAVVAVVAILRRRRLSRT